MKNHLIAEIKCPENVDKVVFDGTCLFTNGSTCPYNCTLGYRPTTSYSSMTCVNGVWNNARPCEGMYILMIYYAHLVLAKELTY